MINGKLIRSYVELDDTDWCLHWRGLARLNGKVFYFDEILQDLKEP